MLQFLFYINRRYILETQLNISFVLLMILQRYTFGSKSQRKGNNSQWTMGCLWYCKDIHLEANHNAEPALLEFTALLMILQRYTFGSKSQPLQANTEKCNCCLWYCKDIHLEANHNYIYMNKIDYVVAYDIAKIYIWKQITT